MNFRWGGMGGREGAALPPPRIQGGCGGGEAPPTNADSEGRRSEGPDSEGPDSEGPDSEGPDSEGPDSEGPDSEYPKIPPKINQNPGVPDLRTVTP